MYKRQELVGQGRDALPGGAALTDELWIGAELDALGEYISADPERALRHVRLFIGYSGWAAGQLEAELAMGSWVPAPFDCPVVFEDGVFSTWKRVVRSVGKDGIELGSLPPDVNLN